MKDLIIDCFAGGGGASTGIEACARVPNGLHHRPRLLGKALSESGTSETYRKQRCSDYGESDCGSELQK